MSGEDGWPRRRLGPLRDLHVADLLERTARAIDSGADVTPEPLARGPSGRLLRTTRLRLPFRRDMAVRTGARVLHPRVDTMLDPTADPRPNAMCAGPFTLEVTPFQWQAAELRLRVMAGGVNWAPMRHWFLEWVQPRQSDESPDLLGAVHSMSDPDDIARGARMRIDFGSAPIECVAELLEALSRSGAVTASLGPTPEAR
jgi:hypothetical protein